MAWFTRIYLFLTCAMLLHAHIDVLNPPQTTAGAAGFTLKVAGRDLEDGEYLVWNNTPLATTVISSTELEAVIPATLIRTPGNVTITLAGYNSLPFVINPPPVITTLEHLPNGTAGAAYAKALERTGGSAPFQWTIESGTLPAGLTLNSTSGVIGGIPTANGTATFTVRLTDDARVFTTKVFSLTIGTAVPATPSCVLTPQNVFLAVHHPDYHLPGRSIYPDHTIEVLVTAGTVPIPGVSLQLTGSRVIFADAAGIPAQTAATAVTNTQGIARYVFNPPLANAFDRTDLVARGVSGGTTIQCAGTLVVGSGTMTAISRGIGGITSALLPRMREQFGADYGRFSEELVALVEANPKLEATAAAMLERFEPVMEDLLAGRPVNLRRPEVRQLGALIDTIQAGASPALRKAITRWRNEVARLRPSINYQPVAKWLATTTSPVVPEINRGRQLSFESNQTHFLARGARQSALLTQEGVVLGPLKMKLSGQNRWPRPTGVDPVATKSHYLNRNNSRTEIPHFAKVRYPAVYPGTDLVFYGDDGRLRYDFVLSPGAKPDKIAVTFEGVKEIEPLETGDLLLHQQGETMRLGKPFVYQERNGKRQEIASRYVRRGKDAIGFEIAQYDRTRELIIDPVLTYATLAGGANDDAALAIAVDRQGSAYVAGFTSSPNRGNVEAFVTKFSPDGKSVIYTTYFGGDGYDIASGIAVDAAGNAYICGSTSSNNFPVLRAAQTQFGGGPIETGGDGFVVKLNAAGNALEYATYLGGSAGDAAKGIAVDAAGSAFVTGFTSSLDFPVRNALQSTQRGGTATRSDAFAAKLNPTGETLIYSTYIGGAGDDFGMGIAVDTTGSAHITGITYSRNYPTQNAFQPNLNSSADGFLTKLTATGAALTYSTYLGGESDDFGLGVAVDANGSAYVTGTTGSGTFPLRNPAQPKFGAEGNLGFDAFVAKFAPAGNTLVYSTYLGGSGIDIAHGIAVAPDGAAYIAGETDSANFPINSPVRPAGAGNDGFIAKLTPNGATIEFASYLGGQSLDSAMAVAVDTAGNAYIAGGSSSPDQPATAGAAQTLLGGRSDAFAIKISAGTTAPILNTLSAAALKPGANVAPDSIVSLFGAALAPQTTVAPSAMLPESLAGTTVTIRDSAGTTRTAPLYFVSATQINAVIPTNTAAGLAELTVQREGRAIAAGTTRITNTAPALFTANSNGQGAPVALAIKVEGEIQTPLNTITCGPTAGTCQPAPLPIGAYLSLFGTGIRNTRTSPKLTIGGIEVPVSYAGAQGQYMGFDQINVGPLPASLAGKGLVDLILTIDGENASTVIVRVE